MNLRSVDGDFVSNLRSLLPARTFMPDSPKYTTEPRGLYHGQAGLVLGPETATQVSVILAAANAARMPVVPFGGSTGLWGGQVLPTGPKPVVLSLERMNKIRSVHVDENVIIAEAGVILENLQIAAAESNRLYPLSLASQGSCQIGGNLATNAGGVNVLRYGNARDLCLGLEAVLPDGQIWHGLKRLRKDNTGYDLKHLLIGAEGTLGVITAASLRLFPIPARESAAMMVVTSPKAALQLLEIAAKHVGNTISAFELIHGTGLQFLSETMPDVRQPFADPPEWSVLIDIGSTADTDPAEQLTEIFELGLAAGLVADGVVAQNEVQRRAFWTVRETIPAANKHIGPIASHDISLPLGAIDKFIKECSELIATIGDFRINSFGHLGDGNLHYNIFPPKGRDRSDYPGMADRIRRTVHDLVAEYDGSFSAEHGLGRLKVQELQRYGDPAKFAALRAIKQALDPNGIMNPGVIFG
ncbi:MAG: FAD-binding oxidoreductase [Paracoccaceae bacterium]